MFRKSVALAAVAVLASGGAAYAAKPTPTPVDPTTLPQGAPPAIAYHASRTGIITPSGTIATPLTTAEYGSVSYGPVDGRYVVKRYESDATSYGSRFYLVDQAGNATRVGGTYPQLDHGSTSVGSGFAGMTLDYTPTTDAPMALLNLRTGQDFHYENPAYQYVSLFTPTPKGVPFSPSTKKSDLRTVKMWRADGSFKKLFTLPKGRRAEYVDLAHKFVFSSGTKQRRFVSTPGKPAKVRWSTGAAYVAALNPTGKRVLLRKGHGKVYELRKVSNGKLLRSWKFALNQFTSAAFEDNGTFLLPVRSADNQPDTLIRCRLTGPCEKAAGPAYDFGFNN